MNKPKIRPAYYGLAVLMYLCLLAIVSLAFYGICLFLVLWGGELFGFDGYSLFAEWWGPILAVSIGLAWLIVFRTRK